MVIVSRGPAGEYRGKVKGNGVDLVLVGFTLRDLGEQVRPALSAAGIVATVKDGRAMWAAARGAFERREQRTALALNAARHGTRGGYYRKSTG